MENSMRTRLLVADIIEGRELAQKSLSADYDLEFASTMQEAKSKLLGQTFDMAIVGMHFDDSRCLELLSFVRTIDNLEGIPFLIIQAKQTHLAQTVPATQQCAPLLGACEVLEALDLRSEEANEKLKAAVERCLHKAAGNLSAVDSPKPSQ